MKTTVKNPVLRGFNPDPSMIFVDGVYYIATSTFEWYPGVQIHKSKDLVNWELASRPLNRLSLLNMKGNPKSSGVWAPCLTHDNGLFYLVYSDMKTWADEPFKDAYNFITTCETIDGEWSEPAYVNSSGFDPSLFHDTDGRKWFVNMEWDHRNDNLNAFTGILIQEWDPIKKELIGEAKKIFEGTKRGLVEGPHIYKKDDYYYLICAEGGTDTDHAESVARSKNLLGPYEVHPNELLISSRDTDSPIRKAGHGSWCVNDKNEWYFAHLCGRYLDNVDRCPLGRETSIQEMIWEDGWPYLKSKTLYAEPEFTVSEEVEKKPNEEKVYTFNNLDFLKDFQTLRVPYNDEMFSIDEVKGKLRVTGLESPFSTHKQSILARRQTDFVFTAETTLEFSPTSFQHMAGLVYRYDEDNQYYLFISHDDKLNSRILQILSLDKKRYSYLKKSVIIDQERPVTLGINVNQDKGQFYYEIDGVKSFIGEEVDTSILSDEYANPMGFTGAFIGIMAQDLKQHKQKAYFSKFVYKGFDK